MACFWDIDNASVRVLGGKRKNVWMRTWKFAETDWQQFASGQDDWMFLRCSAELLEVCGKCSCRRVPCLRKTWLGVMGKSSLQEDREGAVDGDDDGYVQRARRSSPPARGAGNTAATEVTWSRRSSGRTGLVLCCDGVTSSAFSFVSDASNCWPEGQLGERVH